MVGRSVRVPKVGYPGSHPLEASSSIVRHARATATARASDPGLRRVPGDRRDRRDRPVLPRRRALLDRDPHRPGRERRGDDPGVRQRLCRSLTSCPRRATPSPADVARLEAQLATLPRAGEILRVELRRPDGTIVAASDPGLHGVATRPPASSTSRAVGPPRRPSAPPLSPAPVLATSRRRRSCASSCRSRWAARSSASWASGATPSRSSTDSTRCGARSCIVTLTAGLVAAGLLFLVFRSAQAAADPTDRRPSSNRPAATR